MQWHNFTINGWRCNGVAVISNLVVGIEANTKDLESGLGRVDSSVQSLGGAISSAMEGATTMMETLAGKVEETGKRIGTALGGAAEGLDVLGGGIKAVGVSVFGLISSFATLMTSIRAAGAIAAAFPGSLVAKMFTRADMFTQRWGFSLKGLAERLNSQPGLMGKVGGALLRLTTKFNIASLSVQKFGGVMSLAKKALIAFMAVKITSALIRAGNEFVRLKKHVDLARNSLLEFTRGAIFDRIAEQQAAAETATKNLTTAWAALGAPITAVWNDLSTSFLTPALTMALEGLTFITQGLYKIWSLFADVLGTAWGWVSKIVDKTPEWVKDLIGVTAATDKARAAIKEMGKGVETVPTYDKLVESAKKLKDQLNPIHAQTKLIADLTIAMGAAIVAGKKDEIELLKVSREFEINKLSTMRKEMEKTQEAQAELNRLRAAGLDDLDSIAALDSKIESIRKGNLTQEEQINEKIREREGLIAKVQALGGDAAATRVDVLRKDISGLQEELKKLDQARKQVAEQAFIGEIDEVTKMLEKQKRERERAKEAEKRETKTLQDFVDGFKTPAEVLAGRLEMLGKAMEKGLIDDEKFKQISNEIMGSIADEKKAKETAAPTFGKVFDRAITLGAFEQRGGIQEKQLAVQEKQEKALNKIVVNTGQPAAARAGE